MMIDDANFIIALLASPTGCFLTKVVTVLMRVGGAIVSVVLVVRNVTDEIVYTTADVIDLLPL